MTFHPLRTTCDRPDTGCACEVFINANETSGGMFYTDGKTIMAKVVAALPTSEDAAVTAAAAVRLIEAQGVGTAAARFHLVYAVRDHLVASRLTPGGCYKLWTSEENNLDGRAQWGLTAENDAAPFDARTMPCTALAYGDDAEPVTFQGVHVINYQAELDRRGEAHVFSCPGIYPTGYSPDGTAQFEGSACTYGSEADRREHASASA